MARVEIELGVVGDNVDLDRHQTWQTVFVFCSTTDKQSEK
jgi:hypothetical protein